MVHYSKTGMQHRPEVAADTLTDMQYSLTVNLS